MDISKVKVIVVSAKPLFGKFVGITPLPNTIFILDSYKLDPELVAHELGHVQQWRELGWKFLPKYIASWARGGFTWENNEMEKDATARGEGLLEEAKALIRREFLDE